MTEDDASESDGADDGPLPNCPRCGEPVLMSVVIGPGASTLEPCGCAVSPTTLMDRE
ncbi:hypothetical protein [Natrinema saccharevitans]|uniref:hypothetical protein n=1 Tax=Natrinema saccharevitans TaxID=301967 RepID=UPI00158CE29B|nr:hypothetical protein [Natrinema saccharevitans]